MNDIAANRNLIPNLLSQIMYNIPDKVQLVSIQNTTGKNISIVAQSYKYEQLGMFMGILKTKGIPAIGRDEVSKFLGEHVKADAGLDYRDFYSMYTIRRDNARSRARLKLEGPKKTLEDYFIQFITAENKEKQNNDTFAKS